MHPVSPPAPQPRCGVGRHPPLCETADPVDETWGRRGALLLGVDVERRSVVRFGADRDPEPNGLRSRRALLASEAAKRPDPVAARISTRRVALFLPPEAEWQHAEALLQECAKVGIWDIAFAVAAAPEKPK